MIYQKKQDQKQVKRRVRKGSRTLEIFWKTKSYILRIVPAIFGTVAK